MARTSAHAWPRTEDENQVNRTLDSGMHSKRCKDTRLMGDKDSHRQDSNELEVMTRWWIKPDDWLATFTIGYAGLLSEVLDSVAELGLAHPRVPESASGHTWVLDYLYVFDWDLWVHVTIEALEMYFIRSRSSWIDLQYGAFPRIYNSQITSALGGSNCLY